MPSSFQRPGNADRNEPRSGASHCAARSEWPATATAGPTPEKPAVRRWWWLLRAPSAGEPNLVGGGRLWSVWVDWAEATALAAARLPVQLFCHVRCPPADGTNPSRRLPRRLPERRKVRRSHRGLGAKALVATASFDGLVRQLGAVQLAWRDRLVELRQG